MAERIYTSTGKVVNIEEKPKKKKRTGTLTEEQAKKRLVQQAQLTEEEREASLKRRAEVKSGKRVSPDVKGTLQPGDKGFYKTGPSVDWDFKTFGTVSLPKQPQNVNVPSVDIHSYQEGQLESHLAKKKALGSLLTKKTDSLVNITTRQIEIGPHSSVGTSIKKKKPVVQTSSDFKTNLNLKAPIADTSERPVFLRDRPLLLSTDATMPKDSKEVAMRASLAKLRDEGGVPKSTTSFAPIKPSEAGTLRQYLKTQVSQLAKMKSGKPVEGNYGSQAIRHIENRIVNYISKGNEYVDIPIEGFNRKIRGTKMAHLLAEAAFNDPDIQSQMNPADKKLFGEFGGKGRAGFAGKSGKTQYISEHWAAPFGGSKYAPGRSQVATELYSLDEEKAVPISSGSKFRPTDKNKGLGAFNTKRGAISGVELSPNPRLIVKDPGARLGRSVDDLVMHGTNPLSSEQFTLNYQLAPEAPSASGELYLAGSGDNPLHEAQPYHTEIGDKIVHSESYQTKLSAHSGALQWTPQTDLTAGVSRSQLKHYYPKGTVLTVTSPNKKVPLGTMSKTGNFIPIGLKGDTKKRVLAPTEVQSPEWKTVMQLSAGSGLYGQDVPEGYLYDDPQARAVQSGTGSPLDAPHRTGMDIEERGLTFSGLATQTKEGRIADPARTGVVDMEAKQLMELDILDLDAEESRLRKQQELNQKIMHQGNVITGQTEDFNPAKRSILKTVLIKDGAKISHGDRQHSTYIDEGKARRKEIKSYDTSAERGGVRTDALDLEGHERAWVRVKDKKGKESWKYRRVKDKDFKKSVEIIDQETGKKKIVEQIDYERHKSFKKVASAIKKKNVEIELANVKEGKPADQGKQTFYQDKQGQFHVVPVEKAIEARTKGFYSDKGQTPQITGYNRQGTLVTSTAPRVEGNVATTGKIKETQAKAQQKWGEGSLRSKLTFGTNLFVLPDVIHALRVKKDTEKTGKEFNIGSFIPPYARKIVYGKQIPRS